jgi:hypothetical protein
MNWHGVQIKALQGYLPKGSLQILRLEPYLSAVNHGYGSEIGLWEVWDGVHDPEGWLTLAEVVQRFGA